MLTCPNMALKRDKRSGPSRKVAAGIWILALRTLRKLVASSTKVLDQFGVNELIEGLDQLGQENYSPETLSTLPNLVICHGTRDKIAPFTEAKTLAASVPSAQWVALKGAGHIPFFDTPHVDQILSHCNA